MTASASPPAPEGALISAAARSPHGRYARTALLDMGLLQMSRFGGLAVGLLVLPQYSRLLGEQQFALASSFLSLQALLLVLDLGMSVLVGRGIAAGENPRIVPTALRVVSAAYAILTPLALIASRLTPTHASASQLLMASLCFWALTVQNIEQTALLASRRYAEASILQVAGVAIRGFGTWLALVKCGATVDVFLFTQATLGLAHAGATHWRFIRRLPHSFAPSESARESLALLRKGKSVMVFGIAGAAVMNVDRLLVSSGASPALSTAYYLATSLCLTPLTALAGPVAQYFQPRVVLTMQSRGTELKRTLSTFVDALIVLAVVPAALLWLLRQPIVLLWLGPNPARLQVVHFAAILLPGLGLGALGYVPYMLLVAREDYKFQARASLALTMITLAAVTAAVAVDNVSLVCWIYTSYHATSTVLSWLRAIYLDRGDRTLIAARAARRAALLTFILSLAVVIVAAARP